MTCRIFEFSVEPVFSFSDTSDSIIEIAVPSEHHKGGICPSLMKGSVCDVDICWCIILGRDTVVVFVGSTAKLRFYIFEGGNAAIFRVSKG